MLLEGLRIRTGTDPGSPAHRCHHPSRRGGLRMPRRESQVLRQILDVNRGALSHHACMPQHVFQFPDVARPGVPCQHDMGSLGESPHLFAELPRELLHKITNQQGQIFRPILQRRHVDFYHRKPIVQILAEQLVRNRGAKIAMRGRDDMNIHTPWRQRSDPQYFLILQSPQQLGLSSERHVANFVEEYRAAVGILEQAHLVLGCAREGAAHVSEKFALKQRFHHGRTVQHDKPPIRHRAEIVQSFRGQFLTRSGFTRHQHIAEMWGNTTNARKHLHHCRAAAHHVLKPGVGQHLVFQLARTLAALRFLHQPAHPFTQSRDRDGLIQIVRRALTNRFHGRLARVVSGHQYHVDRGIEIHYALQHFKPGNSRHDEIRQHDLRVFAKHDLQTLLGIARRENGESFPVQRGREHLKASRVVVDNHERHVW